MAKNGPNLRDFRIDSREIPEDSVTHPRQTINTRLNSSVQEWGSNSWQGRDHGDLWQSWEEDEEFQRQTQKLESPAIQKAETEGGEAHLSLGPTAGRAEKISQKSPRAENVTPAPTQRNSQNRKAAEPESVPGQQPMTGSLSSTAVLAWATELALEERKMDRMGVVDFSNSFKKQDLLKRMTREFMRKLRESFQRDIEVFNGSRQSASHGVHLYRVSNTEEDFMLFRNGVKLVVSGERSGRVVLAFNQFLGQIFTPSQQQPSFELEASWGAFDQLHWNYRGERVSIPDVVRYFLSEFVRQSYK